MNCKSICYGIRKAQLFETNRCL